MKWQLSNMSTEAPGELEGASSPHRSESSEHAYLADGDIANEREAYRREKRKASLKHLVDRHSISSDAQWPAMLITSVKKRIIIK